MGYARHIGRVGALAVAMGVGVGLITTPATARADGAETSDSSSRDSGGGSEPSGTTGSTGRTEPPKTTDAQDDSSETAPKGISGAGAEGTSPPATVGGAHDPLTENAGTEDVPESEPPSAAEPTDAPDAPDTTTSPSAPGGAATPPDDPIAADESPGVATGVRQTSGAISRSAEPDPAVRAVPAAGGTAVSTLVAPTPDTRAGAPAPIPTPVRVRPVTLPPPTPIEALVAVPGTLITVTAGVVRALLRPFLPALAGAPGVPASPTTLWAVLG